MKSTLFINTKAPYSSLAARESIDAALATAAFGVPVGVLFIGDGVFQLRKDQQPTNAGLKRTGSMLEAFELYGIEDIHVCQSSLELRGMTLEQLLLPAHALDHDAIRTLLTRYDHLLTF